MQHLLSPGNREIIAQLAWANVLLALDDEGTLAPIVSDPAKAALPRSTRALLSRVAERYPCAVVSGRGREDVQRCMAGVALRAVVGNHGLEPLERSAEIAETVRRWLAILANALGGLKGVVIEDKRYSIAIHYRAARAKKQALVAIRDAVGTLGGRVLGGKLVINVLPAGAPHKGVAVERLRDELGCDTALYLGDDESDEDVFSLDQPGQLTTVRVGRSASSRASYFISSQAEIDRVLEALLDARPTVASRRTEPTLERALEPRAAPVSAGAAPALGPVLKFMRSLWAVDHGLALTSRRMEGALGVTGVQRLVLRIVGKWPGLTAGQLAQTLHLDPSTLTPVLQRLAQRRLLMRHADPNDRRRTLLGLTASGRALDRPAAGTVESVVEEVLRAATQSQIDAAETILAALADGLTRPERRDEPATSEEVHDAGQALVV